jgi:hypothetical protein
VHGEARNTRDPSQQPPSRQGGSYKPKAKSSAAERGSEGTVVVVMAATNNATGAKGPCGGRVVEAGKREGMAVTSGPNNPGGPRPSEKVRQLQRRLCAAAKRQPGRRFHALYDHIGRSDVLLEAWRRARSNKGAAGVDSGSGTSSACTLARYMRGPNVGRESPNSDALRRAFRTEISRKQRRSDGTVTRPSIFSTALPSNNVMPLTDTPQLVATTQLHPEMQSVLPLKLAAHGFRTLLLGLFEGGPAARQTIRAYAELCAAKARPTNGVASLFRTRRRLLPRAAKARFTRRSAPAPVPVRPEEPRSHWQSRSRPQRP